MKRKIRMGLKLLYWLLGISAYLGITVGLPYSDRVLLELEGPLLWWQASLALNLVILTLIGTAWGIITLHSWAFEEE